MSLDIGEALSDGARRSLQRNGLVVFGLVLVVQLLSTAFSQTQLREQARTLRQQSPELFESLTQVPFLAEQFAGPFPLALPVSGTVAQLLGLLLAVPNELVLLVAARTFVSDETEGFYEPWRNQPVALVSAIVAGLVATILIGLGLLLLVIPGIFLAVAFVFIRQEVAVGDAGFVDALTDSYARTKGNRLRLFALLLVLFVISLLLGIPGILLPTVPGTLVSVVVGAATTVFSAAVVAQAYRQLSDEHATTDPDEGPGALTADDLDQQDSFGTTTFDTGDFDEGRGDDHDDHDDHDDDRSTDDPADPVDPGGTDDDGRPDDPGAR